MKRIVLTIASLALLAVAAPARAETMGRAYAPEEVARIDILPGWRMKNGHHMAALRIRMADGWKTYWRAPGEAGIPPAFDWSGSENVKAVAMHWPTPEVFSTNGMQTVGYSHELVLPLEFQPEINGESITLNGRVVLGVCFDVCMPMQAEFTATLTSDGAPDVSIRRAIRARPDTESEAGLRRATCDVEPIKDGLRVTAQLDLPRVGPGEFVVFEAPDPGIWVSQAVVDRDGRMLTAKADLVPPAAQPFLLSRADLRFTVLAQGRAVEINGCTAPR